MDYCSILSIKNIIMIGTIRKTRKLFGDKTSIDTSSIGLLYVSANDTTAGYLNGKLVAGTNMVLTENNDGGNETLSVSLADNICLAQAPGNHLATPTLRFGDCDTGIYEDVDDSMVHSCAGVQVMKVLKNATEKQVVISPDGLAGNASKPTLAFGSSMNKGFYQHSFT